MRSTFKADYAKARDYCDHRRNVTPGVYNERRLYEFPVPAIDNEADQRPDPDEHAGNIERPNRQHEPREIEDDVNMWSDNENEPLPDPHGEDID